MKFNLVCVGIVMIISACDSGPAETERVNVLLSFQSPTMRQTLASANEVVPVVTINGEVLKAKQTGLAFQVVTAAVVGDDEVFLEVSWFANNTDIQVADYFAFVDIRSGNVFIDSDSYDTNFDQDADGESNLHELEMGTLDNESSPLTAEPAPVIGDVNGNGMPDVFEVIMDADLDVNNNSLADVFETALNGTSADINNNGVDDSYEAFLTSGADVNADGADDAAVAAIDEVLVDVDIPRISSGESPFVDGIRDDVWGSAISDSRNGNTLLIDHLIFDSSGTQTDRGVDVINQWSAMHDGTNLYLYVEVRTRFVEVAIPSITDNSGVEIFLDGDNSKGSVYDSFDDQQLVVAGSISGATRVQPGANSVTPADGLASFAMASDDSGTLVGYDVEVSLNLSDANIFIGRPFGIEIQINENYDGGLRDAKWGWAVESFSPDVAWLNPSVFGTAVLQ